MQQRALQSASWLLFLALALALALAPRVRADQGDEEDEDTVPPGSDTDQEPVSDEDKCQAPTDIVLVSDSSGSIRSAGFASIQSWLGLFLDRFSISAEGAHIAVVQFTNRAQVETPGGLTGSASKLRDTLDELSWLCETVEQGLCVSDVDCTTGSGSRCHTGIGLGLEAAAELLEQAAQQRETASRVVVLLTDGEWNVGVNPIDVLPRLQALDTTVVGIGVGSVDVDALGALVSPGPDEEPDKYLILTEDWSELEQSLPVIEGAACQCIGDCNGHGACSPRGVCQCDVLYSDEDNCEGVVIAPYIAVPAALAAVAAMLYRKPSRAAAPAAAAAAAPAIESAVVHPPIFTAADMGTDIGATGAPPPPDNRPTYWPASHAAPTKGTHSKPAPMYV